MAITVFLVDDHPIVREGLRALLEADGAFRVVGEAAGGRRALQSVQKLRPQVVVMDIAMPGISGIEATVRIVATCPDTRVVILSIHSSKEYIFRALQAGARGYLLKESAGREVIEAVKVVHSGRRYLSAAIAETVADDYLLNRRHPAALKSPLERLSPRELEILRLVVTGQTSAKIAEDLYLSPKTVETYRHRLMGKLGVQDIPGLVKFAIRHGLSTLE